MNIRTKLLLGFGVAVLSSGIVGVMSIQKVQEIVQYLQKDIPVAAKELEQASHLNGLAQLIRYYEEVLTQSARNYAFTSDEKWADRYREHESLLDDAIIHAIEEGDKLDSLFFSRVEVANGALVDMEYNSIRLVEEARPLEAIEILESKEYWDQKQTYISNLNDHVVRRGLTD